jgi:acetyl-CoA C-acetyltransferase
MNRHALIIDAVRSPRGRGKTTGALHLVHPQRILAQLLEELERRQQLDTADVDDVLMGCASGTGDHGMDIARMAALDAGWSIEAPGVTLNRFCGSGQSAVNLAAMSIISGFQHLVVAGGVESMSRIAPSHTDGFTANNAHLRARYDLVPQGIAADLLATREGFTRTELDNARYESTNGSPSEYLTSPLGLEDRMRHGNWFISPRSQQPSRPTRMPSGSHVH